jgi:hypothetical protein
VGSNDEGEGQVNVADIGLQNLWLSLQKTSWQVLAVVPATRQIGGLEVANLIAEVAWHYRGEPTVVLDLRDINLRVVEYHKKEIEAHTKKGASVIVALSAIQQNPSTIALARAADAAVLVVRLGDTSMKSATSTVAEIGHDHFAGMILTKKKKPIAAVAQLVQLDATRITVKVPARGART